MGAVICGLGYYTLIWGQIAHDETDQRSKDTKSLPQPSDEKVPLLIPPEEDSPV